MRGTCIVVTCLALTARAVGHTHPPPVTALEDVTVVPMTVNGRALPDQTVVLTGDRITFVGVSGKVRVPDGAVRIDGRGKFLLPGLDDIEHAACDIRSYMA